MPAGGGDRRRRRKVVLPPLSPDVWGAIARATLAAEGDDARTWATLRLVGPAWRDGLKGALILKSNAVAAVPSLCQPLSSAKNDMTRSWVCDHQNKANVIAVLMSARPVSLVGVTVSKGFGPAHRQCIVVLVPDPGICAPGGPTRLMWLRQHAS
jgi:hypothetical protein